MIYCIWPLMICVSVGQNPPGYPLLFSLIVLEWKHFFSNYLSIVPAQIMTKASYNPGTPMFLQDGHNPHIMLFFFLFFFQMWTDPDPLTMSLTCIQSRDKRPLQFKTVKLHISTLCQICFQNKQPRYNL